MADFATRVVYEMIYPIRKKFGKLPYLCAFEDARGARFYQYAQFDTLAEALEWHAEQLNRERAHIIYRATKSEIFVKL